jgi:hypothetical protein
MRRLLHWPRRASARLVNVTQPASLGHVCRAGAVWCAALLALASPRAVAAATYYVDYLNGSNANPGTQAQPWKTPPGSYCSGTAYNSSTRQGDCLIADTAGSGWVRIQRGDTILLNAGQSYPLQWFMDSNWFPTGTSGATITVDRYGSGADPIIEGGDLITNLPENTGWTAVAGQANIYSFPLTCGRLMHQVADGGINDSPQLLRSGDGGSTFIRWAKGGNVVGNSSLDSFDGGTACTAAALTSNSMRFYDCPNNRMCVRSDTDPRSDGSLWYIGWRAYGIHIDNVNNLTIQNLQLRRKAFVPQGTEFGGEVMFHQSYANNNVTLNHLTVTNSGGSGIRLFHSPGGDPNTQNLIIQNSTINDSWMYGLEISNSTPSSPANFLIDHNVARHNGDHGLSCNIVNGCVISNNISDSSAQGQSQCGVGSCGPAGPGRGHGLTVTGVTAATRPANVTIKNNVVMNTAPSRLYGGNDDECGIYVFQGEGTINVLNNVTYNNGGCGIVVQYDTAPDGPNSASKPTWKIVGNTVVDDVGAGLFFMNFGMGSTTNWLTVRDNFFGRTSGTYSFWSAVFFQGNYSKTQTWDHNNAFVAGNTGKNYWCGNGYQATPCSPWSDIAVAPQFVNAAGHDYHLASASPLRNAGTATCPDTPLDLGGVIRPQESACDIGAYEYTAAAGTPPPAPTLIEVVPLP